MSQHVHDVYAELKCSLRQGHKNLSHKKGGLIPSAPQAEAIQTPSSHSQDVCGLQEELNFHVMSTGLLTLDPGCFLYFILSKHEHSNDLGKDTNLALVFDASGSNAQSVIWK